MSYNNWDQQQQQQQQQQQYGNTWGDQSTFSYDMGSSDFGPEQQFQTFDYNQAAASGAGSAAPPPPTGPPPPTSTFYSSSSQQPTFFTPAPSIMTPGPSLEAPLPGESIDDEPPLLEELGINPDAILQKTLTVLNPMRRTDPTILQDTDLAGPLAFCLAFGSFLLLSGKAQFGYIYGIGLLGCISMYGLLNMMSMAGVSLGVVVSILGYCLLPMVGLAGVNVLLSLQGMVGMLLTGAAILWCSVSASKLFVTGLSMDHQQPLVAYPCALLYAVFALITIF